jgi:HAE1 family hydrophobic/amphiphilic exporter-1
MRTIFALLVFVCAAWAQDRPARVGVGVIERKLTLEEAIAKALSSNVEIEIERTNLATASESLRAAEGAFDPVFRWQPLLQSRTTPTPNVLTAADGRLAERFHSQNFYFLQKLPWRGTSFHVDFENNRQSNNIPFNALNPFYTSRLLLGFQVPLLRNREIDRERAQIRVRSKQIRINQSDLETRVIDVVTRVETAYWNLRAARADVEVEEESVELAREQLARTRRMIDSGTLAPVEIAAAEAELERRRDTLFAAIGVVTQAENALKTLIAGGREEDIWNDAVAPITEPEPEIQLPDVTDWQGAVRTALANRPELRSLESRTEQNRVERDLNRNLTKPQVDLVAGYANAGLAGSLRAAPNPFAESNRLLVERLNALSAINGLPPTPTPDFGGQPPSSLIGNYGQTLSNLFGGSFQTFQVGVSMDLNIRNRTAEANLAQTVINERRLRLQRVQVEQIIEAEVRNSLQALQTAQQRIAAAEASVRAAREKLESETRLFQSGESTNFLVLTRQNEYADSRRRLVRAQLDRLKALALYRQATGQTLEARNIQVK